MSVNKIASGTDYKLDCEVKSLNVAGTFEVDGASTLADIKCEDVSCNEITCAGLQATFVSEAATHYSTAYSVSAGDKVQLDASAKYTLGDLVPANFVGTPTALSLLDEERKVFDRTTTNIKYSLTLKGNFTVLANLPANNVLCAYSMTISDVDARYLNADVLFKRGNGVSNNGIGAAATFITVVDTSVVGEVKIIFSNQTHTQILGGATIVNDFEVQLLA
jgi:hypothetical protein